MGSDQGRADEKPAHRVSVATFYLDETEVTAAQYARCVQAGVCEPQATVLWSKRPAYRAEQEQLKMENESCNLLQAERQDHPMNCVDWYQANRFCAWVYKRLPTEEEWEFAARGPGGRTYPWGNEEPTAERANICGEEAGTALKVRGEAMWISKSGWNDGFVMTSPVTAFPLGRTPDGLYALGGNVTEWTASHLCGYADEPCTNQLFVSRGNAWVSYDQRPAWTRGSGSPVLRAGYVGFRCASTAAASSH